MVYTKRRYYLIFVICFLLFGILIAGFTSFSNYRSSYNNLESTFSSLSHHESDHIRSQITNYIMLNESLLYAVIDNTFTHNYVISGDNTDLDNLINFFYGISSANKNVMQLRYIDSSGMEIVRVDRLRDSDEVIIIPKDELQDKSHRYYFKEAVVLNEKEVWHSNVDLNVENGEIEEPLNPTFRIATPLFVEGNSKGIIIINLMFENILNQVTASSNFNVYIIDKDGESIYGTEEMFSWSRYLENRITLNERYPDDYENILHGREFHYGDLNRYPLGDLFGNDEGLILILNPREEVVASINSNNVKSALLLGLSILLMTLPLSWVISLIPSKLQEHLSEAYETIEEMSTLDTLTGLHNRRKLESIFTHEISVAKRNSSPLWVLLIDIDFFKKVNDVYGHIIGDNVLVELAEIIVNNSRDIDYICRWGGEEFLIISTNNSLEGVLEYAEKLRSSVDKHVFKDAGHVTVSCGVSGYSGEDSSSQIVAKADKALYTAKEGGRNCVLFHS